MLLAAIMDVRYTVSILLPKGPVAILMQPRVHINIPKVRNTVNFRAFPCSPPNRIENLSSIQKLYERVKKSPSKKRVLHVAVRWIAQLNTADAPFIYYLV